jgi:TRAP-type mannitol/chloroaromatic compound transport system permease large subunit
MIAGLLEFGATVVVLTFKLVPLLVAFALAFLIKSKVHAVLIVANLWLFMELATTLLQPGYGFASLFYERLVASAIQVAIGHSVVTLWRYWRVGAERVTVH